MKPLSIAATALAIGLALPAAADPTLGFGLSITFGGNSAPETGLGLRVFSDDERDSAVASIGLDYMFQSQRLRPTVGAAYLGSNSYIGLDMGYDFSRGGLDFSVGAGLTDTQSQAATVVVDEGGGDEGGEGVGDEGSGDFEITDPNVGDI